ncbi:MAG: hypothetical protein JJU37_13160 [Balneolaceae bacterium]|nr:hypothetical protein [Balneolaceae bacterium]
MKEISFFTAQKSAGSSWFILLLACLTIFSSPPVIYAQTNEALITSAQDNYTISRNYNTENGLPANGVNQVIQDSRGYIWAATFNGLIRFDGKRISVYNTGNIPGLETNRFIELVESPDGKIWAGLEYSSLVMIDQDSSHVYKIDEDLTELNTYITKIFFDDTGKIWVGTNFGVFILENEKFRKIEGLPNQGVQKIYQHGNHIYVLYEYSMHRLKLDGELEEILLELSESELKSKWSFTTRDFDHVERFWDLFWYDDHFLLVHEHGILKIEEDGHEVVLIGEEINQSILHGIRYRNGYYYIYGADGLYRIEDLYAEQIRGVQYTNIRTNDVLFDHEGSIWISTSANGLIQFVDTPVYQGDRLDVLSQTPTTAILQDSNETLWVGTNCDGLYAFGDNSIRRFGIEEGILNVCVWSLLEQTDGTIWAGTWGGGVFYLPPDDNIFQRFEPEIMEDVNAVLSVFEDTNGHIWFGSFGRGLYRFDGEETALIKNQDGGNVSTTRMIYEDDNGTLLFATDRGIGYFENGVIIKPEEFNQLETRNFRTINKDSEGRFWFGSYGGGIFVLNQGGESKKITIENGLFDNTISQLQFDDYGNLWLAGNMGVFFIEKNQIDLFLAGEILALRVSRIGVMEGLPIRETTGGFMPSSFLNDQGELYIPTMQGLAMLSTERLELNRQLPKVYIEEIEKNGITYPINEISKIPHDAQRIIFRFTALSFKNSDNVKFEFMLEGFDATWQQTSDLREAIYTSLPAGSYTFRVRAANNDGFWNEEGALLAITVTPPFWQTAWFFLLSLIVIITLLVAGYRYRVRNIHKYNLELQKEVEERTKELKISNEELKNLLEEKNKLHSILAHDLRNPFNTILGYIDLLKLEFEQNNNEEYSELTNMILDSGRKSLNLLENLLQWSGSKDGGLNICIENIELRGLLNESVEMAGAQANFKNVNIILKADKPVFVKADKNMTKTIVRNLLSNAIKFSGSGTAVTISLSKGEKYATITVADNGVGIGEESLNHIFDGLQRRSKLGTQGEKGFGMGLALCKEFVLLQDGKIWVESTPGAGSIFTFTLPLALKKAPVNGNDQLGKKETKEHLT